MLNTNRIKPYLTRTIPLIIISRLVIALRTINAPCAHNLFTSAINLDAELTSLVLQLVAELLTDRYMSDLRHFQAADVRDLADSNPYRSVLGVEQFRKGFLGDVVVDFDLPDDGAVFAVIWLFDGECHFQTVHIAGGVPGSAGAGFAELGAAVLAVGGSDAAGAGAGPGYFGDEGVAVHVEVVAALPAVAAGELGGGDGVNFSGAAGGKL